MHAQRVLVPQTQIGAIQAHLARSRRLGTDQQAGQGRLARTGRADDAQRFSGRQLEAKVAQAGLAAAGLQCVERLDGEFAARRRQRHACRARRLRLHHSTQALISQPRRAPLAPGADQLIDRCQHPRHQNGTGDHHAWGDQLFDRQPRSQA
ncbi:hypothetical protein D3C76_1422000 [compost metagenome]